MNLRQAAQQALEALEMMRGKYGEYACLECDYADSSITVLRAALAETEQDAVGWQWLNTCKYRKKLPANAIPEHWRPLYTAPTPRKPLLASDIVTMYDENPRSDSEMIAFARAIERAHGIGEQA